MNMGSKSMFGIIGVGKCKCYDCMGYIPFDRKVFDSGNGDPMSNKTKEVLKESLPSRIHA